MFLEKGDYVISEDYTFATAVETAHPLGCKCIGVAMDSEGMLPDALDELLTTWDEAARGARKPFLVYTIPTGQNPTGATQGAERRRQIYAVAQKHDLVIIEDEPYYFLQMQPYTGPGQPPAPLPANHKEFLNSMIPSLLSMDVDGRVIRLDSFSKVLAPGSRCGWVVAPEQVCERMQRHAEVSSYPAGISQVIIHRLVDEEWGHGGYLDWLINLRVEYTQRRDVLVKACDDHLPHEVCSWTPPAAGMFHWVRLDVSKHPDFGKRSVQSIEDEVFTTAVAGGVLITPGSYFLADTEKELEHIFFRATFAAAAVCFPWTVARRINALTGLQSEAMVEAIKRFGVAVRQVFRIKN